MPTSGQAPPPPRAERTFNMRAIAISAALLFVVLIGVFLGMRACDGPDARHRECVQKALRDEGSSPVMAESLCTDRGQ